MRSLQSRTWSPWTPLTESHRPRVHPPRPPPARCRGSGTSTARNAAPCQEGDVLELRMETFTSSGQALGRLGPSRWVVMVFGALPMELVQLKIVRNFKGRSEAKVQKILEKSPERVEPRCPIFSKCSGCQYQHLTYEAQLYWKREHVQQAGGVVVV
eukprot:symbB.v1.2.002483.t1/scaffold131.1/size310497/3